MMDGRLVHDHRAGDKDVPRSSVAPLWEAREILRLSLTPDPAWDQGSTATATTNNVHVHLYYHRVVGMRWQLQCSTVISYQVDMASHTIALGARAGNPNARVPAKALSTIALWNNIYSACLW